MIASSPAIVTLTTHKEPNRKIRFSCEASNAVSYEWHFRPFCAAVARVQAPKFTSDRFKQDLVIDTRKGEDDVVGHYFCVASNPEATGDRIAISEIVQIAPSKDEGREPIPIHLDPNAALTPETTPKSSPASTPQNSAASLLTLPVCGSSKQPPAKKAKKDCVNRWTCSGSEAVKESVVKDAILKSQKESLDARLFSKIFIFDESNVENFAPDKALSEAHFCNEFQKAVEAKGHDDSCSLLSTFFSTLFATVGQMSTISGLNSFTIPRGDLSPNFADSAVVLKPLLLPTSLFPLLLTEVTRDNESPEVKVVQLHKYYEFLMSYYFPQKLAFAQFGTLPVFGLVVSSHRVTLHGFANFNSSAVHTKIMHFDISDDSAVMTFIRFIYQRIRSFAKEWEDTNYDLTETQRFHHVIDSFVFRSLEYSNAIPASEGNIRGKNLFRYTTQCPGEDVIVKYFPASKRKDAYGTKVHECLARHEMAPRLLHQGVVPYAKSRFVVMEYVDWPSLSERFEANETDFFKKCGEEVMKNLHSILNLLHDEGMVHGDFRPTNILVSDEGLVRIVDFDWSAATSEAKRRYPENLNADITWPCISGAALEEVHDQFFFAAIKTQIRQCMK